MSASEGKQSWFKTLLGTVFGLLSGAVVMWLSPLLDRAIKPAKPLVNFAYEVNGLAVTFHDRTTEGSSGRWDFGDGAPLEFVGSEHKSVTHTYARPGTYTAKLVYVNLFNEEGERSVVVEVGAESPGRTLVEPQVLDLFARPPGKVGQLVYAPATFQFQATADDAQLLVWDFGDGSGIEVGDATMSHTYQHPGTYRAKVVAFNGKAKSEKQLAIQVGQAPVNSMAFRLRVTDEGAATRTREVTISQVGNLVRGMGPSSLEQQISSAPDFEITNVERRSSNNQHLEPVQYQMAPDRKSFKAVAAVAKNAPPTSMVVLNEKLMLTERSVKRTPAESKALMGSLVAPGTMSLRLPAVPELADVRRQISMEILQGSQVIWRDSQLPKGQRVAIGGRLFSMSSQIEGDRLQISLTQAD